MVLLSKLEKNNKINPSKALEKVKNKKKLSKNSYKSILLQLKNWIERLEPKEKKTIWDTYSEQNTYNKAKSLPKVKSLLKNV